jgi:hypothetical protein
MDRKKIAYFDSETVSLLRATLDDAWVRLRPEQQATTSRSILAEGMLKSAAKGERNPKRLRDAALTAVIALQREQAATQVERAFSTGLVEPSSDPYEG